MRTAGWSSIGDWIDADVTEATPYLFNDKACLVDERSREREALTIGEGIARLRAALRTPKQCIRLIGLSGLGKTRLAQALFESGVGAEPLDPGIAVYTDYSTEPDPTARDMARHLVVSRQRATLIVDNCNPATHSWNWRVSARGPTAMSACSPSNMMSAMTSPNAPKSFGCERRRRRSSPSGSRPSSLMSRRSTADRIAEFSDGNFRVARAVAETLERGETLGKLKSRDLFERIFHQRNQPDQTLLAAAEDLSLLYSVDGEDTHAAGGELAIIAAIGGVGAGQLYAALVELWPPRGCRADARTMAGDPAARDRQSTGDLRA